MFIAYIKATRGRIRYFHICKRHLNHQIRGIEAQKDVMYISQLCDSLGVKFFVKSINVPEYCKKNGLSIEEGARKLRYEMFYEIKQKLNQIK